MGQALLDVRDLAVSYGAIKALHGVSLRVDQGQIVALVGANGAGKTTLLRTISGLLRPTAGSIIWSPPAGSAQPLQTLPPHQIVELGISHVPEGRQIFAHMTVRENLLLGGYARRNTHVHRSSHATGTPAAGSYEIDDIYTLFPVLGQRRNQKSGTLSGGEQQMLAIGRALMAHPRLLLLDEPSLGLAPLIVRQIFQIIRELNHAGATIFLVEQNARMALGIAHRAYVMQSGQIIKTDDAAKLLDDPEVKKAYLGG